MLVASIEEARALRTFYASKCPEHISALVDARWLMICKSRAVNALCQLRSSHCYGMLMHAIRKLTFIVFKPGVMTFLRTP